MVIMVAILSIVSSVTAGSSQSQSLHPMELLRSTLENGSLDGFE